MTFAEIKDKVEGIHQLIDTLENAKEVSAEALAFERGKLEGILSFLPHSEFMKANRFMAERKKLYAEVREESEAILREVGLM